MCAALAKAASVLALSPWIAVKQMLFGQFSQTSGAPALGGLAGAEHGRQRLVVHLDQLGGVHRLVLGLGDHEGDVVADEAHAVLDQRRVGRLEVRRAVAALVGGRHRHVAPAGLDPVLAGQHRQHARRGLGRGGVDLADFGVGVRRAQHVAERHPRQHDVVHVLPPAAQQPRVFKAGHRLTDCKFTHYQTSTLLGARPAIPGIASLASKQDAHGRDICPAISL